MRPALARLLATLPVVLCVLGAAPFAARQGAIFKPFTQQLFTD